MSIPKWNKDVITWCTTHNWLQKLCSKDLTLQETPPQLKIILHSLRRVVRRLHQSSLTPNFPRRFWSSDWVINDLAANNNLNIFQQIIHRVFTDAACTVRYRHGSLGARLKPDLTQLPLQCVCCESFSINRLNSTNWHLSLRLSLNMYTGTRTKHKRLELGPLYTSLQSLGAQKFWCRLPGLYRKGDKLWKLHLNLIYILNCWTIVSGRCKIRARN